ncbi:MAG: tyrosine-type recombinase/integrase [Nevskia sp.]|nr:tyrosine-type recombinase/integrase [Nevskia sp.]
MASKLLKDRTVGGKKVSHGERLLADGDGLYLRVRPAGKDWLFIYSLAGRRRKMGLGPYPAVTLERARTKALDARAAVADQIDPIAARESAAAARKAAEAAQASRQTIRSLFELWHRKEVAASRRDGGAEIKRAFEKDVLPVIGDMFADEVARRHVMGVLDAVKERGVTRIANQLLAYLRQMFRFGAVREIVSGDPTFGIRKKDVGGVEPERTRVLAEDEIRELATKLPDAGLTAASTAAVWAILATCCRVGEISRARVTDINLAAGAWVIPADHSKNGREHLVHLSDFAKLHFGKLLELAPNSTWIFPSADGATHASTKSLQKQFRDRQRAVALKGRSKKTATLTLAGGEWTAHDLRRTAATLMGELGVRPDVIDRCLNHVAQSKITKTYQRQELLRERSEAFALLGDRLALLARGVESRVIPGRFRHETEAA